MSYLSSFRTGISLWSNDLSFWLAAILTAGAFYLVVYIFKNIFLHHLRKIAAKTTTKLDDLAITALESFYWPLTPIAAVYIASLILSLPDYWDLVLRKIFLIALAYCIVRFVVKILAYLLAQAISRHKKIDRHDPVIRLAIVLMKIALWSLAFLLLLSNLGFNVSSLLTGLGIGGIAIGLALQNVLGDLFSSFAIYLDKPFKPGDFITVGNYMGTVKAVGIKTTRIEALQGEEIIISNSDLAAARVQNFGQMQKRRVAFDLALRYDTSPAKLRQVPQLLAEAASGIADLSLDRCHFKKFGDWALIFETVYFIASPDIKDYMDKQQELNFKLLEILKREKIALAFPTKLIHLEK